MKILISGATGLVGSASINHWSLKGHAIKTLVRSEPKHASEIRWTPPQSAPSPAHLEGIEAVVHLAGESIASGRWTESKKRAIRDSRVAGTRLLSEALAAMKTPPKVLISASAIGFYGDRGDAVLREDSPAGPGFLAEVCRAWEAATAPALARGIRVVHARFGIILSSRGGALSAMLLPFRLGLGGKIGPGSQYMSWIALDDVVSALSYALVTEPMRGAVNVVAPNAVTNAEFTKTLGRVIGRPTLLPMPAFAARLAFGEMADALLLGSARVEPGALARSGFHFQYPDLDGALRHLLNK